MPQFEPSSAQVLGTHGQGGGPASGPHAPQSIMFPHPSPTTPQETSCCAHVNGTHTAPPHSVM
jgi:hypothetical protein